MRCVDFVELVTTYLEGGLADADRTAFEQHLAQCSGCETYLDQFRTTIALLGELPAETISPAARSQLLDAFATWSAR